MGVTPAPDMGVTPGDVADVTPPPVTDDRAIRQINKVCPQVAVRCLPIVFIADDSLNNIFILQSAQDSANLPGR